jgi:transposase
MFWILRTGAPWRDLPRERYGPWRTVWRRFDQWRREGRLEEIKQRLLAQLNEAGVVDWDLWCVDGTGPTRDGLVDARSASTAKDAKDAKELTL